MTQVFQCTLDTYNEMVAFIAKRNTAQQCLVLGDSASVIEADFKMMEYKPLETFYVAIKNDKIVGAIGIEHDQYILGPWTDEQESLAELGQLLYNHAVQIAKEKKYGDVRFYINGESAELYDFITKNGGNVEGNEWGMEMFKQDYPPVETNPELECSTIDPTSDIGEQVLQLHIELFGDRAYNTENWERRTKTNHLVLGCFKQSKLLSYAIIQIQADGLYLSHIGTYQSARGQGSASKLLIHLREYFVKSDYPKAFLNVQMKNAGAARLYERAGFKACHKAVGLKAMF
ncbi:hypothetical protein HDV06_000345 [Boothiomyces sp. JEL0866]|nr:hypothetical protein HDV06_000345 [Boothiomyces sp. JEL0866]